MRQIARTVLVVVTFFVGLSAALMMFAQDRLFDADSFSTTVASTLEDPAVNGQRWIELKLLRSILRTFRIQGCGATPALGGRDPHGWRLRPGDNQFKQAARVARGVRPGGGGPV